MGAEPAAPRNPFPTVDVIIERSDGFVVLIRRKNPPEGWALPGGFVDTGESTEDAARREAREETGLDVVLTDLLGVYSDPERDPRFHTLSVVYIGHSGDPLAPGDDAIAAEEFSLDALPEGLVFDHALILDDFRHFKATGRHPDPAPRRKLSQAAAS
ncbi:MAG: NUDIX hydrolase [Myxococcota bacterium]|nr:NUDIX hydrolase [Myxococcota bacterium]